ncbi:MAG TPA: methyltransferase domain-containing protein [Thermoanaerobaculaceae bacterium]|nr:methyltransferase domain-containing protein [Thermoanaerobaculaceae bacterium]
MPVTDELLQLLQCPVAKRPLRPTTDEELRTLNRAVDSGRAGDAGGVRVTEPLAAGLATEGEGWFYPVRDGAPVLVPERRITIHDRPLPEDATPAPPPPNSDEAVWEYLATVWHTRRPPARPSRQDTALLERLAADALADRAAPRALMLGVTPEIATMRWPAGTRLVAIDASAAMIRTVWPAAAAPGAAVIRGDWAGMPIRDGVFDIVVGDASLGFQPYPDVFFGIAGEVRRVLRDDGFLATRVFTRPETRESIDAILADLRAGKIGSLHFLWWRMYAALHGDRAHGVTSRELWEAWTARVSDTAGLFRSLGWPPETVQAVEGLRSPVRTVILPTVREYRDDLAGSFEQIACEFPEFEDGDRYPTVGFRVRPR